MNDEQLEKCIHLTCHAISAALLRNAAKETMAFGDALMWNEEFERLKAEANEIDAGIYRSILSLLWGQCIEEGYE